MDPEQLADLCDSLAESAEKNRRQTHRSRIRAAVIAMFAVLALVTGAMTGMAVAKKDAPETPATDYHGLPGNNGGFSDQANGACPAGAGANCDGGIHGIGNNPGQSGDSPADQGVPACNMHGGLDAGGNCD